MPNRNSTWMLLLILILAALVLFLLPGNMAASVEPDRPVNDRIAFTSTCHENYKIYSMLPDGTDLERLTTDPDDDYNPSWSPDGEKIAFTSHRDGDYEIYVMNADGSDPRRLTFSPGMDDFPAWSPDGSQIVFTSARTGNNEILIMNADGTYQTRLTTAMKTGELYYSSDHTPAWSPDGRYIVFVSTRDGDGPHADASFRHLYVMRADGTEQIRLTSRKTDDAWPSWSPDGLRIAYVSGGQLCQLNFKGSWQACLRTEVQVDGRLAWSPDGQQIIFGSYVDNAHGNLYVINADGSGLRQLTDSPGQNGGPSWSR